MSLMRIVGDRLFMVLRFNMHNKLSLSGTLPACTHTRSATKAYIQQESKMSATDVADVLCTAAVLMSDVCSGDSVWAILLFTRSQAVCHLGAEMLQ